MVKSKLKRPLRFKTPLFSMDASVIDLCLSIFPWAEFRQTKGAVKLHRVIHHEGYPPVFADLTNGKTHEINIARRLKFPKGSIVVFDLGGTTTTPTSTPFAWTASSSSPEPKMGRYMRLLRSGLYPAGGRSCRTRSSGSPAPWGGGTAPVTCAA